MTIYMALPSLSIYFCGEREYYPEICMPVLSVIWIQKNGVSPLVLSPIPSTELEVGKWCWITASVYVGDSCWYMGFQIPKIVALR